MALPPLGSHQHVTAPLVRAQAEPQSTSGGGLRNLENAGVVLLGAAMMPFGGAYGGAKLGTHLAGAGTAGKLAAVGLGAVGLALGAGLAWSVMQAW